MLKTASLTPEFLHIIKHKGTEVPFSGEYDNSDQPGTYLCRQCGLALFRAEAQFNSGCGWPSFDHEIDHSVRYAPDADGQRTEILCARCDAHLGHVFYGEGFSAKNTRHCVNTLSLDFVNSQTVLDSEEAIFAAGCFWGVEYYLKKLPGVIKTEVGYIGGKKDNPSYEDVCSGKTGHYEALRVVFDKALLNYEQLTQYFFEIHDPSQSNGQGPDIGSQYLSAIFYYNEKQKNTALRLIQILNQHGYVVATKLLPVTIFWAAEGYHQDYYQKTGKNPYCHHYVKKFT